MVKAVIELKSKETTDLNRFETQAFDYKNNQPECVYMITSNFEKLRFYIDSAIENIEFIQDGGRIANLDVIASFVVTKIYWRHID